MFRLLVAALVASAVLSATPAPVLIFHGLGDMCINPGMSRITKEIGDTLGTTAACIEIGNGALTSFFEEFEQQAEAACKSVQNDDRFKDLEEISVMGLSHGALIARYMIEECELKAKVRNYVSIGGPHQGVATLPQCSSGVMCDFINSLTDDAIYFSFVQKHVGPAGYFKDPKNFSGYQNYCTFLPALNNEGVTKRATNKLASINHALLIMFSEDTTVYPKESEWFGELTADGTLLELKDTDLYKNDEIGLKALMDANKVDFVSIKGNHLQFTDSDLQNIIIPALAK